jgi:hypothetical protein
MSRSSYAKIINFGPQGPNPVNDPLSYTMNDTLDRGFLHGGSAAITGPHSKNAQLYMSQYCAEKWDQFCENASTDQTVSFPNQMITCGGSTLCTAATANTLTAGDMLVRNTATRKYLVEMNGCTQKYEPFDPTVPTSPLISTWVRTNQTVSGGCVPVYDLADPVSIDSDPVMNKILDKPVIAMDLLVNLYTNMKLKGTLHMLHGTRLGNFYQNFDLFRSRGGLS